MLSVGHLLVALLFACDKAAVPRQKCTEVQTKACPSQKASGRKGTRGPMVSSQGVSLPGPGNLGTKALALEPLGGGVSSPEP